MRYENVNEKKGFFRYNPATKIRWWFTMEQNTHIVSEESVFNAWLSSEKEKGLVDIKLYPNNISTASRESFYGELNAMNHAFAAGRFEEIKDL